MVYRNIYKKGFTIVELLVVIVVIGILATITIVSYAGIQSRASVAAMQSDLSNASNKLKLYQVDNGNYPATITDAINAKLISTNSSMDYYSYNVDNVSNPQYFCYMYRKGTDVYAVDSNSTPGKGACLTNLVSNGSFSGGTSGWGSNGAVLSVASNILTVTGNGTYNLPRPYQIISYNPQSNTKLYIKYKVRVTNSSCSSLIVEATNDKYMSASIVSSPVANQWYDVSVIVTTQSNSSGNITIYLTSIYTDNATANGKIMEIQYVSGTDLTAAFGSGNEPTAAQMNTIVSGYPNSWFSIVAKANL